MIKQLIASFLGGAIGASATVFFVNSRPDHRMQIAIEACHGFMKSSKQQETKNQCTREELEAGLVKYYSTPSHLIATMHDQVEYGIPYMMPLICK